MTSRISRLILALLGIAVATAAVSLFGGWGKMVVDPAAGVLWLAWRVLASIPQYIYWTLVILLAALPLFRLASVPRREDFSSAYRPEEMPASRVEFWRTTIRDASLSYRERRLLDNSLKDLAAGVASSARASLLMEMDDNKDHTGPDRPRGVWGLSDLADRGEIEIGGLTLPIRPPNPLRPLFRRLFQPDYKDIERFLRSLEEEMDIFDDIDSN